jgi:hypothetical protein
VKPATLIRLHRDAGGEAPFSKLLNGCVSNNLTGWHQRATHDAAGLVNRLLGAFLD